MIFILALFSRFICLIFLLFRCLLLRLLFVVATALLLSVPNPSLESLSLLDDSSFSDLGFALSLTLNACVLWLSVSAGVSSEVASSCADTFAVLLHHFLYLVVMLLVLLQFEIDLDLYQFETLQFHL